MRKTTGILLNLIFFVQVLLLFLWLFENRVELPVWFQVAGRLHPAILHLPIGLLVFMIILLLVKREFKKKVFRRILTMVLLLASVTASITALFGFFLSQQGDYGPDSLSQHKISGLLLSFLCYGLVLVADRFETSKSFTYLSGIISIGLLLFVGHTGATLTHGENYVFAPLKKGNDIPADASVFQRAVFPVLEKKCVSCHNEAKAKGKFVMTTIDKFKNGGKKGVEWVAGNPEESRMIQYIHLPLGDDHHMPPDGKPQLTKNEIKLLQAWVRSGGDFIVKPEDLKEGDSLKLLVASVSPESGHAVEEKVYEFPAASGNVVERLNTPFRSVFPLYQGSPALQADFFLKASFQAKALEELVDVKNQLVVLNLSKMPVTDANLQVIGEFRNLEKLNLNFSQIKGPGLISLKSLDKLTSISLAGTEIDFSSLTSLLELPALTELFIWSTKITPGEYVQLVSEHPNIMIANSQFSDEKVLRLSRPVLMNEGIIKQNESIILKHAMPNVVVRYTVDGTKPDSLSSTIYEQPFKLNSTAILKAMACKPGWYCSELLETTCFVAGLKPEHTELLTTADKQYPGEGAKSLTDQRKGFTDVLKEPSWLGFRDVNFVGQFDFGKNPPPVHTIVLSYAENIGGYIFPPVEVEVWAGPDKGRLKLIKTLRPEVPKAYLPQQTKSLSLSLGNADRYAIYKIVAKPISKLPPWHSGKGKKGWFFVDEVFFY